MLRDEISKLGNVSELIVEVILNAFQINPILSRAFLKSFEQTEQAKFSLIDVCLAVLMCANIQNRFKTFAILSTKLQQSHIPHSLMLETFEQFHLFKGQAPVLLNLSFRVRKREKKKKMN